MTLKNSNSAQLSCFNRSDSSITLTIFSGENPETVHLVYDQCLTIRILLIPFITSI